MAVKIENNHIFLAVRDLLSYTNHNRLASSFPLPQRGILGRKAQTKIQQHKDKSYGLFHSEYKVRQTFPYLQYQITVQGRIDGVYKLKERVEIEEIKSVLLTSREFSKLQPDKYPEFKEQLLFYAYLLEEQDVEIKPYLVLINLTNDKQKIFDVAYHRLAVERLLFQRFDHIISVLEDQQSRSDRRLSELEPISFTLPERREQQQDMMQAVDSVLTNRQHLLVSAPTGTGKTAAALFPAIQFAYAKNKTIFFATSKTTQQHIVYETIKPLIEQGLNIKSLFLRASEKMCANDIYFCHEEYCPYIDKFRDRLYDSNILEELSRADIMLPELIYSRAQAEMLCPFEVSLELSLTADIIIGDYNYVFDPAVFLRRLFESKDYSDWILVIDEAHNLYERGLNYLSPQLKRRKIKDLIGLYKDRKAKVYNDLVKSMQEVDKLFSHLQQEGELYYEQRQYFNAELDRTAWIEIFQLYENAFLKYLIHKVKKHIIIIDDPLETLYYALRQFIRVARFADPAFIPFYNAEAKGVLKIQCCDPSGYFQNRMEGFHSIIAMSATLEPMLFYQTVLGFHEERTKTLQLDTPFPAKNRKYIIIPHISTKYRDRIKNYKHVAEIIERTVRVKQGNYLVFFPSFEYLQNVNLFLTGLSCHKIIQRPGMNEAARDEVLNDLRSSGKTNLLLGVIGGIFAEGIDYKGRMAIGVIVISPALPKLSYERELQRGYWQEKQNLGMEYAYIYPGMNKVIQSIGRLIRSASDRGIALLIGQRFASEQFARLLPEHWYKNEGDVLITEAYYDEIKAFWDQE